MSGFTEDRMREIAEDRALNDLMLSDWWDERRDMARELLAWRELGRDLMSYDINAGDARPRIAALLEGGTGVS